MFVAKKLVLILPLIVFSTFTLFEHQESFGYYDIGFRLDKTCEALIATGDYSTCPTYDQIEEIFPKIKMKPEYTKLIDSEQDRIDIISNRAKIETLSRSCILFNQCDIFSLTPKQTANYWHNPSELLSRSMDVITITPNMKIKNPVYLKYSEIAIITNNDTRQITFEINQLHVNQKCKEAIFTPGNDWQYELGHLIHYMKNDCKIPKVLTRVFDMHHIEETDVHEYDPMTSPNYQYRLWLEEAKTTCKQKC